MFRRIFGASNKRQELVGEEAVRLTKRFFRQSPSIAMRASTFTELFAYTFFNFDFFTAMKHPDIRDSVGQSLSRAFSHELESTFSITDQGHFINALNLRVQEYGALLQHGSRPSDVFERFAFHFLQTDLAGDFNGPDSPVQIGSAFEVASTKRELATFCSNDIPKLVKKSPRLV